MSEVGTRLQEPADRMACGLQCQGRRDCGTGGEHHCSCRQNTLSDINTGTSLDKEYKIMSVKIKVELLLINHNAQSPCNMPQIAKLMHHTNRSQDQHHVMIHTGPINESITHKFCNISQIIHKIQSPSNKPQTAHNDVPYQHVTQAPCVIIHRRPSTVYNAQISAIYQNTPKTQSPCQ